MKPLGFTYIPIVTYINTRAKHKGVHKGSHWHVNPIDPSVSWYNLATLKAKFDVPLCCIREQNCYPCNQPT